MGAKTAHYSVRVEEEDREVLRRVAEELGLPPAVLVRYAVKKYVINCKDLDATQVVNLALGGK
jgi:predicted DNA-binding protein